MVDHGKHTPSQNVENGGLTKTNSLFARENQKYKILHIDDHPETLEISKIFLEEMYSDSQIIVHSEPNSSQLENWLMEDIDCFVVDYNMPNRDGLSVITEIRRLKDTPIVLFTNQDYDKLPKNVLREMEVIYHQKNIEQDNYYKLTNIILDLVKSDQEQRKLIGS